MAFAPDNWGTNAIYVAFTIGLILSGVVSVQRIILMKYPEIREVINQLRVQVNLMQVENNKLESQVDTLQEETNSLNEMQKQLSEICDSQGQTVDQFSSLVKSNADLIQKIKEQIKARVTHDMITIVLRSDRDESFSIEPKEVPSLILRLESQAGVKINKEKFEETLQSKGCGLDAIMELVRDIADDGKATFTITPEHDMPTPHRLKRTSV